MKKTFENFLDLLFVPRCAACRARLGVGAGALCASCRERYELALIAPCPFCGKVISTCICRGPALDTAPLNGLLKLYLYQRMEGEDEPPQNTLLYRLKHQGDRRVVAELADRLAMAIRPQLASLGETPWVTYAPRSRRARHRYGFDHMRYLSFAVAKRLSLPCVPLLKRRSGSEQKKKASRTARLHNMKSAYVYCGKEALGARPILLLDDITTSGATLASAARILRQEGAGEVLAAVIAYTPTRE